MSFIGTSRLEMLAAAAIVIVVIVVVVGYAGHIGQTSPTPREQALDEFIERRYASGFIAPNYTFECSGKASSADDGSETVDRLREFAGRDALMSRLRDVKVPPYDDKTFKFWCYDTPGLINPQQVGLHWHCHLCGTRHLAYTLLTSAVSYCCEYTGLYFCGCLLHEPHNIFLCHP